MTCAPDSPAGPSDAASPYGPAAPAPGARPARPVRVHHLTRAKERGERLTMLTAYDAVTARILDEAGTDMLLVGDSIGNVMLGHDTTLPVELDEMVVATRSVARATTRALVVADLPFGTYEAGLEQALASAVRLMKAGANAVKLEGGRPRARTVRALGEAGIPVVGHLGFTPQSVNRLGGFRVQGRGAGRGRRRGDRPGDGARASGRANHRTARNPHDRHWRGGALRRPGAGVDRHGRDDGLGAALRPPVRPGRSGPASGGAGVRRCGARGVVPDVGALLRLLKPEGPLPGAGLGTSRARRRARRAPRGGRR